MASTQSGMDGLLVVVEGGERGALGVEGGEATAGSVGRVGAARGGKGGATGRERLPAAVVEDVLDLAQLGAHERRDLVARLVERVGDEAAQRRDAVGLLHAPPLAG